MPELHFERNRRLHSERKPGYERRDEDTVKRGIRFFFAASDLVTALLVLVATFMGLPTRWWPIDAAAVVIAVSLGAAGVCQAIDRAPMVVRFACRIVLAIGLTLIAFLSISASHLAGVYGPIGEGGALLMLVVIALALPYLIALPAAQLVK